MNKWFVLLAMVFCHIVDDYYLQAVGVLAMMKQRKWWEKEAPQKMYRFDYLVALAISLMMTAVLPRNTWRLTKEPFGKDPKIPTASPEVPTA